MLQICRGLHKIKPQSQESADSRQLFSESTLERSSESLFRIHSDDVLSIGESM